MNQKRKREGMSRRTFLKGGVGAGLAIVAFPYVARSQQLIKIKIRGGTILTAPSGIIEMYHTKKKLFEKHARKEGYDLEMEWRDFPYGGAQAEAVLSGKLEFSFWTDLVQTRLIAQKQPVHPVIMTEGYQNIAINVRPNSPIRNVEDLKGKTIGTVLGTVFHGGIVNLLKTELGTADLKKLGINLINVPSVAQLMTIPTGIDAACNNSIFTLRGELEGFSKPLVDAHGFTRSHYKGPAGEGEGHFLPGFKRAPWYPEAYYPFRGYNFTTRKLIDEHPKLIKAFMMATEEAVRDLNKMNREVASKMISQYWKLPPKEGSIVVGDVLPIIRGWSWITENDARSVVEVSKFMAETGALPNPIEMKEVKENFEVVAPIMKAAYEEMGGAPKADVFTDKKAKDRRGVPLWMADKWSL